MNKGNERFRKIFQELKEEDEQNAPHFSRDWNAALLRMNTPRQRLGMWQLSAAAAAMMIFLGTGWWMLFRQSTLQNVPAEIVILDTSVPETTPLVSPPPETVIAQRPERGATPSASLSRRLVKNRPAISPRILSVQPQPPAILISKWRSPTESLLQIPGERLLKSVPRLDDSVVNVKATISNQKN